MTKKLTSVFFLGVTSVLLSGCAGPEQKFGRGLRNATEFARMGEMQRSIEQTALWDGPSQAYTTGVSRGFNRSVARSAYGVWEMATFAFPPYEAKFTPKGYIAPDPSIASTRYPYGGLRLPENPVGPASNPLGMPSDPLMDASSDLGLNGGVIGRTIPGSRFRVFDSGQ